MAPTFTRFLVWKLPVSELMVGTGIVGAEKEGTVNEGLLNVCEAPDPGAAEPAAVLLTSGGFFA